MRESVLGPEELVFEFGTFAVPVLELDRVGASNSGSGRDVASMIILGDLSVEISFDAFTLYWQLQTPSVTALRILVFKQVDNCPTAILLPLTKNQLVGIGVDGHKLLRLAWLMVMTSSVLRESYTAVRLSRPKTGRKAAETFNNDPMLLYNSLHALHVA